MKYKPFFRMLIVLSAATLLAGTVGVSASAATIDPDELIAAESVAETATQNDLPTSYNSAALGYITPVKNQQFNDCWAYSAMGTLESKLLRMGIATDDMSVPHINMWATTRSNGKGWIRSILEPAYCSTAPGYLTAWQGGVWERDAQDISLNWDIKGDEMPTDRARFGVTSLRYVSRNNPDEIKRAIMENGGVTTGYSHNGIYMQSSISYFMPSSYSDHLSGHQIEVIGWDDNYSKNNFNVTPNNNGAWLCKNSWGNNNTLGGLFWISYEDKYIFSSKYQPSFAIEQLEKVTQNKKLIQNEIYGATYEFDYIQENELTFVNRFHFNKSYALLDKVIFETRVANASYELYLVPEQSGAPSNDESSWKFLNKGITDYAGYICVDINNVLLEDSTASIAVKLKSNDRNITIGVDEWLNSSTDLRYLFLNESEYGMSYIYQNGKMTDLMDWYNDVNHDSIGGTFIIKALTLKPETGDVNLDGKIDINDVTLIQQYLAEFVTLNDSQRLLADVNHDNKVDITDATALQIIIAS